jgi:hypothetical protein
MKYLKMLGLAAVAAAALMAFVGAGTASATVICSATENPCAAANKWPTGTTAAFSLKSGSSAKLTDTFGNVLDTCTGSSVTGPLTNAGSATTTVVGSVGQGALTWSKCTDTTATLTGGELEIHNIAGTHNGTVTGIGFVVTVWNTFIGASCNYTAGAGTDLGVYDSATKVLAVNAVVRKTIEHGGSNLCPETTRWVAEYSYTGTTGLFPMPS